MIRKYHNLRVATGWVLLLTLIALPFLRIHGESAFRFDIPSLRLFFFGSTFPLQDFFIVLIAIILVTFLTVFITTVFGRIWCGWLCPQTVLLDVTPFLDSNRKSGLLTKLPAYTIALMLSAIVSASMVCFFVSPYDIQQIIAAGGAAFHVAFGSWVGLTVFTFLDLIALRRRFCATVCPYAKMQSVLFDDRTLLVAYDPSRADECMHCNACVRACPVGIDIRNGTQLACIHCAECVDACTARMQSRGNRSLIQYMFGTPETRKTGLRVNPLLTGSITVAALLFFVYLAVFRPPFDMAARLTYSGEPRISSNNTITNSYELSFRNLSGVPLTLRLTAEIQRKPLTIMPAEVVLPIGTDATKLQIAASLNASDRISAPAVVTFTATSRPEQTSISKSIAFLLPAGL